MEFSRPEYWSGSRSLLQGIFPTQGSKPGLPHCRRILYHLSHQRSYNFLAGCWWVPSFRALIWIPITFSYLLNSLVQQTLSTFYISKIPSVIPSRLGSVPCRREWLPPLVFWPGEFHGQRSLAGYSPWACKETQNTT